MLEYFKTIREEWGVIRKAPCTFFFITAIALGALYLMFNETIARKNDLIGTLKGQLDACKTPVSPSAPSAQGSTIRPLSPPATSPGSPVQQSRSTSKVPDSKKESDPIKIQQNNLAPNTKSYAVGKGNLTVNEAPIPLLLSDAEKRAAIASLKGAPGKIHLACLTKVAGMTSRDTRCDLCKDVLAIFENADWRISSSVLGSGIPPGITVVEINHDEGAQRIVEAFNLATIPHFVSPDWRGPASLNLQGTVITVAPTNR